MSERTSNVLAWIAAGAAAVGIAGCVFILGVFLWTAVVQ